MCELESFIALQNVRGLTYFISFSLRYFKIFRKHVTYQIYCYPDIFEFSGPGADGFTAIRGVFQTLPSTYE